MTGQVVDVADDLDELVQRLRQLDVDPRQSLCVEVGLDYGQVQEINRFSYGNFGEPDRFGPET